VRVMLLSFEYPPLVIGGIGGHTFDLAHGLSGMGVRVAVVSVPSAAPVERSGTVPVYRETIVGAPEPIDMPPALADEGVRRAALRAAALEGKPDLVHTQECKTFGIARELSLLWRVPLVCTVHSTEFRRRLGHMNAEHLAQEREREEMVRAADATICVSHALADDVRTQFAVDATKLRVVHNGIDTDRYAQIAPGPHARSLRRYADGRHVILFVGRLAPEKRPDLVLDVAEELRVRRGRSDLWFWVVGDGRLRSQLEQRRQDRGLEKAVHFWGKVPFDRVPDYYACADLVLLPSLADSFPLTALEAQAAGRTVLAARVGGIPEMVRHGETGIIIDQNDPSVWADAIEDALQSSSLLERYGSSGRKRVESQFSRAAMAAATTGVYAEVLAARALAAQTAAEPAHASAH
jgi:glycogen(starch) synthase